LGANLSIAPSAVDRVTTPAGGSPDIIARLIGQWLSERLGQPFVIEDRPGAGGNIGTEIGVRAPPDGYTLLMALSLNAINPAIYDNLPFNFIRGCPTHRSPHERVAHFFFESAISARIAAR
jgi:tripartite-type tricarboxylate transporter receptor subunit TctC